MKQRIALLTVFFYLCTFANPHRSQAVVPLVAIGAAAVGTALLSSSIGAYYAQNGTLPEYVSATANAVASANDYLHQKGYLAVGPLSLVTAASFPEIASVYLGKNASIGVKLGDIYDYLKTTADGLYTDLKSVFSAHTSFDYPIYSGASLITGAILNAGDVSYRITGSSWGWVGYFQNETRFSGLYQNWFGTCDVYPGLTTYISYYNGYLYRWSPGYVTTSGYGILEKRAAVISTDPATVEPEETPLVDWPSLKDELSPVVPAGVAQDFRDLVKNLPANKVVTSAETPTTADKTAAPPAVTQAEINDLLKQNTAEVAQAAADAAAQIAAANPDDAAAQIAANQAAADAAKAQEEANTQPDEETFSPISATPFQEAYNPGEFDIPARFTTFLSNVKSSGLFSFSSSFFNSLPGGGSPVFEINGGETFGSHTIDLSGTFTGGLTVIKSVLLALFGFFSIRAIILKR